MKNSGPVWLCLALGVTQLDAQVTNTLNGVRFIDANNVVAVGANGTIIRSSDTGYNWIAQQSGTEANLFGVGFSNGSVGVTVGARLIFVTVLPEILNTSDAGQTWGSQGYSALLTDVKFVDAQRAIVVGYSGAMIRTTDGGSSWIPLSSGVTDNLLSVDFVDANTGTATGSFGRILRTNDGGNTWTSQPSGILNSLNAVDMVNSNVIFACGNAGIVCRSTNGGTSWSSQQTPVTHNLTGLSFVDPNNGWAVGWQGVILRTTNGGASWHTQTSGTTNDFYDVSFRDVNVGIAVGLGGVILRTDNGGVSWSDPQLPIQLGSFAGSYLGGTRVRLDWMTISEINNYGFEVQRTPELSVPFTTLPNSFIPGHGTTLDPQYYTFTDSSAPQGRQFYRLRQIDLNGPVHYSDAIAVDVLSGVSEDVLPVEPVLLQNYPNPFNPVTNFEFRTPGPGPVSLDIYDLLGQHVATVVRGEFSLGRQTATWNASQFPSGVYIARLEFGGAVFTRKVALIR